MPGNQAVVAPDSISGTEKINESRMRYYRLKRVRDEMRQRGYGAAILFDPVNIRYATDCRNMQIWTMRNPARYCLVVADGPTIMFEIGGRSHHAEGIETIDEVRCARPWFYYYSGNDTIKHAREWAAEIRDIVYQHHGKQETIVAIDRCDAEGVHALKESGLRAANGEELMQQARRIKSEDEISAIVAAVEVCEIGISRMQTALRPGISEIALWSIMHQSNIELGGEYLETRLLNSGPRTNPWYQEASTKLIEAGELVATDSDLVGPRGYGADICRTFLCGDKSPTHEQRELYRRAHEQVMFNMGLLQVGRSFREIAAAAMYLPEEYHQFHRIAHGSGMGIGEYPAIGKRPGFEDSFVHEGVIEEGMVLCVGSYAGKQDGRQGVRLEQTVVIRSSGPELLSNLSFDDQFLS